MAPESLQKTSITEFLKRIREGNKYEQPPPIKMYHLPDPNIQSILWANCENMAAAVKPLSPGEGYEVEVPFNDKTFPSIVDVNGLPQELYRETGDRFQFIVKPLSRTVVIRAQPPL